LRVSYAFAKGFARGVGIPIWPVPSLQIIAANFLHGGHDIAVISPARRGQAHFAVFDRETLQAHEANAVVNYSDLPVLIAAGTFWAGPGVSKLNENLRTNLEAAISADERLHRPQVKHLARLAQNHWQNRTPPDISTLVPEYGIEFPPPQPQIAS
jgi:tRNA threonylcarbamoyl adenosine modification protein YeaZ